MADFIYPAASVAGATHAAAISPSNSVALTAPTRAVYVGGDGNLVATMVGGETVTFTSVKAGTVLPIQVSQVLSTNTTATNLVALW